MKSLLKLIGCLCLLLCIGGCEDVAYPATDSQSHYAWEDSGKHVVAFSIHGCQQCAKEHPQLQKIRDAGVDVVEVDGEQEPALAAKYHVHKYPTYVIIEDGKVQSTSFTIAAVLMTLKVLLWVATVILL